MHCKDFWEIYETQGLTLELEEHLKICEDCRKIMQAENLLKKQVGGLPIYRAPDRLWTKVSEELAPSTYRNKLMHLLHTGNRSIINFLSVSAEFVLNRPVMLGITFGIIIGISIGYLYFLPGTPVREIRQMEKAIVELTEAEEKYKIAIEKFSSIVDQYQNNSAPELYQLYQTRLASLSIGMEQYKEVQRLKAYDMITNSYLYGTSVIQ